MNRPERDRYILEQFVHIYCRGKDKTPKGELCPDCQALLAYALKRLERCPQNPKPGCKHCPVHCYRPAYRERMRQVMRYSGKRLLLQGRFDLLRHYFF